MAHEHAATDPTQEHHHHHLHHHHHEYHVLHDADAHLHHHHSLCSPSLFPEAPTSPFSPAALEHCFGSWEVVADPLLPPSTTDYARSRRGASSEHDTDDSRSYSSDHDDDEVEVDVDDEVAQRHHRHVRGQDDGAASCDDDDDDADDADYNDNDEDGDDGGDSDARSSGSSSSGDWVSCASEHSFAGFLPARYKTAKLGAEYQISVLPPCQGTRLQACRRVEREAERNGRYEQVHGPDARPTSPRTSASARWCGRRTTPTPTRPTRRSRRCGACSRKYIRSITCRRRRCT